MGDPELPGIGTVSAFGLIMCVTVILAILT